MIKIKYETNFLTDLEELLLQSPGLETQIEKAVERFQKNPEDTRLRNHALRKRMEGQWAFSITGDVRIVYLWSGKNLVKFLAIGGHKKIYQRGKN